MRSLRLLGQGRSFYHCVSRVVDRRLVFKGVEKEVFRSILRRLEAFMGVQVVTYCLMGNHFHLLVEVPEREQLDALDAEGLLALLPLLYDRDTVRAVAEELERARAAGDWTWESSILERYERRRGSLSVFLKELKQRVSLFVNERLDRSGTLWEGRFKSLLIEGNETALLTVAAYIDLNPVRAGLVKRPEHYRWSGYGEAISGSRGAKRARRGLGTILAEGLSDPGFKSDWLRTLKRYRQFLYEEGVERRGEGITGAGARRGIAEETVEAVVGSDGTMSVPAVLRQRVRYFSDGAVLGTAGFVEEAFARLRQGGRASPKRESGARRMRGASWGDLRVLRDLQVRVIGPPG